MEIFGGKCLKDLIHFYDKNGNKTMIKKIHDLIQEIEQDLDPDYVELHTDESDESDDEDIVSVNEVLTVKKSSDGFFSLQ